MTSIDKRPNVFLAGAPKCGTTSLANWLAAHPQCYVSSPKEPHFFGDFLRKRMTLDQYDKLFAEAGPAQKVRIDASTSYFTIPYAIAEILEYRPDARFVVMLRNPVDLVYSLYSEVFYGGAETASSFEDAWRLQKDRKQGTGIPLSCNNPSMLFYRDQALLGQAMSNLLEQVGRERVHWIFTEDLKHDPQRCYRDVLEFLGLDDDGREAFPVMNRAKRHKYPAMNRALRTLGLWRSRLGLPGFGIRTALNRKAKVEAKREPLSEEFRRELYSSFEEDIHLLEQLTGRDLSGWAPKHST